MFKFKGKSKMDPTLKKVYIIVLFISLLTIFSSYWISIFVMIIPGAIKVGTQDGWLSLFGALGGGAMTLFGVWWTIKDQEKKRTEDKNDQEMIRAKDWAKRDSLNKETLAIQFKPILKVEGVLKDKVNRPSDYCILHIDETAVNTSNESFQLTIKNIGRGEMYFQHIKYLNTLQFYNEFIPIDGDRTINLILVQPSAFSKKEKYNRFIEISIVLAYTDLFKFKNYELRLDMLFQVLVNAPINKNSNHIVYNSGRLKHNPKYLLFAGFTSKTIDEVNNSEQTDLVDN